MRCKRHEFKAPRSGVSRILFSTIILLGPQLPVDSSTLPVNSADRLNVHLHGLAPRRVYLVSLRTLSFPRAIHTFCCTCPRLTTDGRYPLRLSMVSGLSSKGCPLAIINLSPFWQYACFFWKNQLFTEMMKIIILYSLDIVWGYISFRCFRCHFYLN